jgi:glycerol dehydrogenase-like iron-containing ADH family enzyme
VIDRAVLELAKQPNVLVGRGILPHIVASVEPPYALVTQPEPLAVIDEAVRAGAASTVMANSLDEAFLEGAAASQPPLRTVVGIGGGMAMDVAKYLAWRRATKLVLAPSIVSVDASVTNTIAVRRGGRVEYDGFVVADPIVVDLELIARAPARLNRAGVGDLLSIQTGRFDWALGARAGAIAFDADVDAQAAEVLEELYGIADEIALVSDQAIEHIVRAYVRVNALLLEVGHSGPEEGSEHYFGYATEAVTGRSFVHGELIGLGIVLMSGLQSNDQARAAAFLDRCRVEWRPARLGLDEATLTRVLTDLPSFVRTAGLPHSIIDERPPDATMVAALLASIPPARHPTAETTPQEDTR